MDRQNHNSISLETLRHVLAERELWKDRVRPLDYKAILESLPAASVTAAENCAVDVSGPSVTIGNELQMSTTNRELLKQSLLALNPWRKGPFNLFGIPLDAEWQSNLKWDRIRPAIGDLRGQNVLDIGANNGYYMYRLLKHNPHHVLGIDPVLHCWAQFELLQFYAQKEQLQFELLGIEHVGNLGRAFDLILNMGILYHHRNPIGQLQDIHKALKPKGRVIVESIIIPGKGTYSLFPEKTYAKMRNVWFVPTLDCLVNWLKRTHFKDIEVLAESSMECEEQRNTPFCPPPRQSYKDFIDPHDFSKTIEGYPAPKRVAIMGTYKP